MDGDTVVFTRTTFTDVLPVSVLFAQIKTGGVGDENQSDDPAGESEPAYNPEFRVVVDVVVDNGGEESTEFTGRGGKTVGGGSDGNGEDLSSEKEGGAAGR